METNAFNLLSDAIIGGLTHFINNFSGLLQVSVYMIIGVIFCTGLLKSWRTFRALDRLSFKNLDNRTLPFLEKAASENHAPLAAIAASFFYRAKKHYLSEKPGESLQRTVPPDSFLRDAASQYSHRYFEEKFLEPISMMANLMPPLGFIGTIIGMVVHFLSGSGSLNSNLTVAGIATALYTTFVALVCFTILEFLVKIFTGLARRRIDEGLTAVADRVVLETDRKAA
jgi:biopolymer transport protein ExbB